MSRNFKAEALQRILSSAREAEKREVPGHKNAYTPEDYNAIRAETLAMSEIEGNDGYLIPKLDTGAVEFDERGNLKEIGRGRPMMLDLAFYTRNRYTVEEIIPANEKRTGKERGTYILLALGNAIVKAIDDVVELPRNIKVYRFKKIKKDEDTETANSTKTSTNDDAPVTKVEADAPKAKSKWVYVGAEMISSERVAKMNRQLSPESALELMSQIEDDINEGTNIGGDNLDDIG